VLDEKLEDFIEVKLKKNIPVFNLFIRSKTKEKIKQTLHAEFEHILPDILNRYTNKLERDIDVKEIVKSRVTAFSSSKLESILYSIMKKEFRFIEIIGGILGFLIGLIQLLLLHIQQS
jgi:uncharacterized membrane protein YheB (UPF0754 family)